MLMRGLCLLAFLTPSIFLNDENCKRCLFHERIWVNVEQQNEEGERNYKHKELPEVAFQPLRSIMSNTAEDFLRCKLGSSHNDKQHLSSREFEG